MNDANKYAILQSQFGHKNFRALQEEAVDTIVYHHHTQHNIQGKQIHHNYVFIL